VFKCKADNTYSIFFKFASGYGLVCKRVTTIMNESNKL